MKNIEPNTVIFVEKGKISVLTAKDILSSKIGVKGYGLSLLPPTWTLPFFVISSEMFKDYSVDNNIDMLRREWTNSIYSASKKVNIDLQEDIFLRSNLCSEGLLERGTYDSIQCPFSEIFIAIEKYFKILNSKLNIEKTEAPLLVQKYSPVFNKGHITNERRISKENRDWKGEIEIIDVKGKLVDTKPFVVPLRNWRKVINYKKMLGDPLFCSSCDNIDQILKVPCVWAIQSIFRIHFEWIFDGRIVYLVQVDEEKKYGLNPIQQMNNFNLKTTNPLQPVCLRQLTLIDRTTYNKFAKIQNTILYQDLELKTAPIYILDNDKEFDLLRSSRISMELRSDLDFLVKRALIIRVDIDSSDRSLRQMLPRTCTIYKLEEAVNWLQKTTEELYKKFVKNKIKFIFIFHNFIPAFSSAFAYAEPDKRNVLIEVLWGLPEGLYYYSHDKYIVDTQHPQIDMINKDDFTIQKKINPKNNFVCPDNNGKWVVNAVSPQYIWKQAITQESYLRDIACQTRKITEHLKKSTSVMWFIGVNEKENKCRVFPWYHEEIIFDDIPKQLNRRKNIYETHFAVKTNEDFYKLQQLISEGNNIKYITYQPIEEKMLRDKDTIKAIGELAKSANATITLEGGILSHAYYQLKRTGVAVEVKEVFHTKKNSIEYNKLVRDEIPKKIENHGEVAVTKELSRDELLQQLKIKMVEEALEVFDSKTKDEIIQELADVAEIFDSIIKRINTNKKEVMSIQKTKRDKVGGFEKGILLRHTENPVYKNIRPNNLSDEQKERKEYFWTDSTEKKGYIKHINIPISLKSFSTNILINDFKTDAKILIHIEGQRENGVMHLDFSVKNETEQSLFKGNE